MNFSMDKSNEKIRSHDLLLDFDDLNLISIEYDNCINQLHRHLQIAKEERKKSENESKLLQHRISLLLNQEKVALKRLDSTKLKLEQIIQNRKFITYNNNLTQTLKEEKKKNIQKLRDSVKSNKVNKKCMSSSYTSKDLQSLLRIREYSANTFNRNRNKIDEEQELLRRRQEDMERVLEELRRKELLEKKMRLKQELLKKIKEDELERNNLEDQLANVEKQETKLLKKFRKNEDDEEEPQNFEMSYKGNEYNNMYSHNNNDSYNNKYYEY